MSFCLSVHLSVVGPFVCLFISLSLSLSLSLSFFSCMAILRVIHCPAVLFIIVSRLPPHLHDSLFLIHVDVLSESCHLRSLLCHPYIVLLVLPINSIFFFYSNKTSLRSKQIGTISFSTIKEDFQKHGECQRQRGYGKEVKETNVFAVTNKDFQKHGECQRRRG